MDKMLRIGLLLLIGAGCGGAQPSTCGTCGTSAVNYTTDASTIFPNPERGLYHHLETFPSPNYSPLDVATLQGYRTDQNITLILRFWYLSGFQSSDISQAYLDQIQTDFDRLRQAGLKAVVRFAYTADEAGDDATKARVLRHIAQIEPILQANGDVIATVQAGFIGAWGEWYYTQNFGNAGTLSQSDWQNRRDVLDALLGALPASRTVQLRTPAMKKQFFGNAPLSAAAAFGGTAVSRVGHHDDCFLASADDSGTYADVAADKAYLAQDSLYVPQGGETCQVSTFSGWTNAAADLSSLHWSFLNVDYQPDVLSSWGSNLDVARRTLGYRFALVQGTYSTSVPQGGDLSVSFTVRNDGDAAPFNPRGLQVILRRTSDGTVYPFALSADPRRWTPGATSAVSESVHLSGVPAGTYDLLLFLPDPAPGLAARPEYAIRLANPGLWEASTGYHKLNQTLTVVP